MINKSYKVTIYLGTGHVTYLQVTNLTISLMQHFSNAGFPCPIMQSPSDHFLRAINTDFDRIIAMCRSLQVHVSSFGLMHRVLSLFVFQRSCAPICL